MEPIFATMKKVQIIVNLKIANNNFFKFVCNEVLATEIAFGSLGNEALLVDLVEEGDTKIGLVRS